jgi:hypothetical protein
MDKSQLEPQQPWLFGAERRCRQGSPATSAPSVGRNFNRNAVTNIVLIVQYNRQLICPWSSVAAPRFPSLERADGPTDPASRVERFGTNVALMKVRLSTHIKTIRSVKPDHPIQTSWSARSTATPGPKPKGRNVSAVSRCRHASNRTDRPERSQPLPQSTTTEPRRRRPPGVSSRHMVPGIWAADWQRHQDSVKGFASSGSNRRDLLGTGLSPGG